jgi:uncharacterized membrane protein
MSKKLYLLIFLAVAFGLRFYKIGAHGLAGDEKYSLFVSQFTAYEGNNQKDSVRKPNSPYFTPKEFWSKKSTADFFDAIARLDTGNGALYTFTLHFWSKIVGLHDADLRLLSLLFNLATILLLYFFVKVHFKDENLALIAVFLATISPFYIAYSQIARNYAMQFFLVLLATHFLLLGLRNSNRTNLYFLLYGITALAAELCHISTFPIFLIHGLFVLIYYRKISTILRFGISMVIPVLGVVLWLNSDGGKWLIDYVNNSVKTYNLLAQTQPDEFLSVATPKNIVKQLMHVLSAMYITADGLYSQLKGLKNFLIAIISIIVWMIVIFKVKNEKYRIITLISIFITSLALYSVSNFHFFIFCINLSLIPTTYYFVMKERDFEIRKLWVLLVLSSILPFVFLVIFALQDGNTFRIIPRYVGYSYVFNIMLIAILFWRVYRFKMILKYWKLLGFAIQLFFITLLIFDLYDDKAPRYFMNFPEPRQENPYTFAADKILKIYAKGDTVLYPSRFDSTPGGKFMPKYSVVDAQLVNFYLPKDSEIIQRVNPNEPDKIVLKRQSGQEILIFDLKGTKYRY